MLKSYRWLLILIFLLSACNSPAGHTHPLVAVLLVPGNDPTGLFKIGLQDAAQKNGVDLWFADNGTDLAEEDRRVSEAIDRKPIALIITPISPDGSLKTLNRTSIAGIRVVCYMTCLNQPGVATSFISGPDRDLGQLSADKALAWIIGVKNGQASIALIPCTASIACRLRRSEFKARLNQLPGTSIYDPPAGSPNDVAPAVEAMLKAHPEISLVWDDNSSDPASLTKMVDSIRTQGYAGKVHVLGAGLDLSTNELINTQSDIVLGVAVPLPYLAGISAFQSAFHGTVVGKTGQYALFVAPGDHDLAQQILTSQGKLIPSGSLVESTVPSDNQVAPTLSCHCNLTAQPAIPTPP